MGLFERYLSVWIALAIVAGVSLGALFPEVAASIAAKVKKRVFVAELFKSKLSTVITADRTRKGLKSTISTEVDTGIIARLSTALTQQNAKPRLNLQKHRRQEKRSASEKYSWVTKW